MRTFARDAEAAPIVVVEPRSRLAAARDLAIIALCVALLAALLLVALARPPEPAPAPPAAPAARPL